MLWIYSCVVCVGGKETEILVIEVSTVKARTSLKVILITLGEDWEIVSIKRLKRVDNCIVLPGATRGICALDRRGYEFTNHYGFLVKNKTKR